MSGPGGGSTTAQLGRCGGRREDQGARGEDREDRSAAMWISMLEGLVRKKQTSSRSLITSLGEHSIRLSRALRKVFLLGSTLVCSAVSLVL